MTVPTHKLRQLRPVLSNKPKSMLDKNFGLTEEEFTKMLQAMKQGDDRLFEHIYLSHYEKCINYLIKFRSATREQAYSATMKALLETRKELIQDKLGYDNLAYLFTNKAGKKLGKIRKLKTESMTISSIEGMDFKDTSSFLDDLQTKEIADCFQEALQELERREKENTQGKGEQRPPCSQLLKLHYYDDLSYPKIARIYYPSTSEAEIITKANSLSKKMNRKCLKSLKLLLKNCLKGSF